MASGMKCPQCNSRFRGTDTCPICAVALVDPPDPLIGRTIGGRYVIEERVGSGGMATVYRGRHQVIGRDVALKFLSAESLNDAEQRERFLIEARAANQINHENIIDITDFGETEDGYVYLVMEYLRGRTLAQEIHNGPLEPRRALRIALQIAHGLGRAHELDVIHRDVKPANVFLIQRGVDPDFVKLLDFGIARVQNLRITNRDTIMGTPEYMSPEQMRGSELGPAADLYGLGCVMFEMLTGRTPFQGALTALMIKQVSEQPPRPSSINPAVTPALDAIVLKLLHKKPEGRHQGAYHLVEDLQALLNSMPAAQRTLPAAAPAPTATPKRSMPAITPDTDLSAEDAWLRRVELYREITFGAYPLPQVPEWLVDALRRLGQMVKEVRSLKLQLEETSKEAAAHEDSVRGTRMRIGRALDDLAQDESRATRQLEQVTRELEALDPRTHVLARALVHDVRVAQKSDSQASLRELLGAAATWADAQESLHRLRAHLSEKQTECEDLRFQMAQLKGRLGTLNAEAAIEMDAARHRTHKLDTTTQAVLERIVPEAERINAHLSAFPQLRAQLARP